jgi:DNA-binding transcriptional MocR family regulator
LLDSGGGLNPFTSAIIRGVIETGGLENNIHTLIHMYRGRLQIMDSALRQHLPDLEYVMPQGGYFFWLRFPEMIDTKELRQNASIFKVDFRPGTLFSSRNGLKNWMRLCFVRYEEKEIQEGILRLKACLNSSV